MKPDNKNEYDSPHVGQRIKSLRLSKKLSQKELGTKLGFSQEAISKIESGKNSLNSKNLIRFADFFEVSKDFLLTGNDINELDTLRKYFHIEYNKIALDNDNCISLPVLVIEKSLFRMLFNTARAENDSTIPISICELWKKKEVELFNEKRKSDSPHENTSFALIPEVMFNIDSNDSVPQHINLWNESTNYIVKNLVNDSKS